MNDFELTPGDKASSLWVRLRAHMEQRLADARERNDNHRHQESATAAIRGEIRCLKALLSLENDRPFVTGNDDQPL